VAAGVAGVVVTALVGGVVWLAPWSDDPTSASLADSSPSPSAQVTQRPTTTSTQHKPTRKPAKKVTPKPTRKTTSPTTQPTPTRTTTSAAPTPTRTTKKPVTSARLSILAIDLSGGPGKSDSSSCYMPPVHFQTSVESSKQGIWVSYVWQVDGQAVHRNRSWVPEDAYTAFATSGQYMLKTGHHTVTLRVTSPATVSKSVSIDICAMETW
jgi:hypothetical protein